MASLEPLLAQELETGGTVVAPTGPRAAAIEMAWARKQLESGRGAWRTPDVIAYRAWLEREAYRAADAGQPIPRPLRAAEEWLLWREATAAAAASEGLEASDGLPERLQGAARILHDWDIAPAALRASARIESRLLAAALAAVEARARDLHAVGTHRLPGLLRAWRPSRAVTFAGFVERSAARRALLRAGAEAAGRCREHEPSAAGAEPGEAWGLSAGDAHEELELAGEWCRSRLSGHPGARLLVIVPDLAERRAQVLQALRRALAPRELLLGEGEIAGLVALEGGTPLAGEPIVRHALATLDFLAGRAEFEAVSAWLRAAFWNAPEQIERAALDTALRERLGVEVTPGALRAALLSLSGVPRGAAERLAMALEAALEALRSGVSGAASDGLEMSEVSAPVAEWARRFERALQAIGWCGGRIPSAREQASVAQFREVLEDLTAIGARMGTVAGAEALRTLRGLLGRRALRLPPSDAAVTLCGAVADPIVRYDGIWIAGLTAEAWPPPAQLDPFIPCAAQRRAGVPAANPAARIAQARELLRRCRLAGSHVVASWPAHGDDGQRLPSALLAEWGASREQQGMTREARRVSRLAAGIAEPIDSLARSIRASRRIEPFEDERGEPWTARRPLPSGTRAIEYQSRCAFRAYAELRLACVPLGAPRPGVAARDRGRLLHKALELAWRELGGSDGLEAASRQGTLARLIERCVERAAEETLPAALDVMARAAQRRERRRAVRLLAELAQLEQKRPPFRVRSTELRRRIEIEGAALEVRIDRIDELDDGRCALFDYKTGRTTPVDWLAERIGNPQLLVYSLAVQSPPAALAMIQLTPRGLAYRGMAERRDLLPKIGAPPDAAQWPEQIGRWHAVVAGLVRDFLRGTAAADPLGDACAVCHLHAFCRIAEVAPRAPAAATGTGARDASD
ncbi:MAG: PD-(D/E)XK nuclease family protein [Steroidobacteraceae bacterium]